MRKHASLIRGNILTTERNGTLGRGITDLNSYRFRYSVAVGSRRLTGMGGAIVGKGDSDIGRESSRQSVNEVDSNERLLRLAQEMLNELPSTSWNLNLASVLRRQTLSRLLWLDHIYKQVLDVPGVICEFGVYWGASLVQLANLRGIYEPYNHSRKIIGFDTFTGFPSTSMEDGEKAKSGDYSPSSGQLERLKQILQLLEAEAPLNHISKNSLVRGDVAETVPRWLESNPQAVISLAIFDMDLYEPSKSVLELILPRLTKGSVLVFDELNSEVFPGETIAVDEVFGLNKLRLRRTPLQPNAAWAVFGD